MTYQSRRVPIKLGPLAQKVYLTILIDADANGLVTSSSWQNLMDFTETKRRDLDRCLALLSEHNLVRVFDKTEINARSPHFEMLGDFRADLPLARRFHDDNRERVLNLRSARAKKLPRLSVVADTATTSAQIVIETIKEIPVAPTKSQRFRQWRFTIRILGYATVRNCFAQTYDNREPFVVGPTKKVDDHWMDIVEFEPNTIAQLRHLVIEAITQHDRIKSSSLHRSAESTLQMKA
jgi:hypothetical protein